MKLEEIIPYWKDVHHDILDRLEWIDADTWDSRPAHQSAGSIRQIVRKMIRDERYWICQIAANGPRLDDGSDYPNTPALLEGLRAARAATENYVAKLQPEGLKAVRTVPGDSSVNRPEANMPVSWIIWYVFQNELISWGQILMRLCD